MYHMLGAVLSIFRNLDDSGDSLSFVRVLLTLSILSSECCKDRANDLFDTCLAQHDLVQSETRRPDRAKNYDT
jgi:hypothetical protein